MGSRRELSSEGKGREGGREDNNEQLSSVKGGQTVRPASEHNYRHALSTSSCIETCVTCNQYTVNCKIIGHPGKRHAHYS